MAMSQSDGNKNTNDNLKSRNISPNKVKSVVILERNSENLPFYSGYSEIQPHEIKSNP